MLAFAGKTLMTLMFKVPHGIFLDVVE